MQSEDIQKIMDAMPELNDFGIGVFNEHEKSSEARAQDLAEGQETLLNSVAACTKTCDWLSSIDKIKTINRKHTSYELKHLAEKDIGYITNGVFITAAIHCEFLMKRHRALQMSCSACRKNR